MEKGFTECHECKTLNDISDKFCIKCGTKINDKVINKCPNCGSLRNSGEEFCFRCGIKFVSETKYEDASKLILEEELFEETIEPIQKKVENYFCPKCGKENTTLDEFCVRCSYRLRDKVDPSEYIEPLEEPVENCFCPKCGKENTVLDEFCVKCGIKLRKDESEIIKDDIPVHLVKCIDCGGDVSSIANSCPKCGRPMKVAKEMSGGKKFIIGFLAAILGMIFLVALAEWSDSQQSDIPTNSANIEDDKADSELLPMKEIIDDDESYKGYVQWEKDLAEHMIESAMYDTTRTMVLDSLEDPEYSESIEVEDEGDGFILYSTTFEKESLEKYLKGIDGFTKEEVQDDYDTLYENSTILAIFREDKSYMEDAGDIYSTHIQIEDLGNNRVSLLVISLYN